ncbi:MAG: site-specific integrase [Anaerolineales bacterium]|nr:site-specific integrase [Anaerolineales bacterium]
MNALTISNNQNLTIGQVANQVASNFVFDDYTKRKADNTLRRHKADLSLFAEYLEHCQLFGRDDLMSNSESWQGMTWGLIKGFSEWMLQAGYAIGSINARLSTIRIYAGLATKAGMIDPRESYLINNVSGYAVNEGKNVDAKRDNCRVGRKKAEATGISLEQAELLKNQPSRRNRLVMHLLLEHGLRVSELSLLKISDFDRDANMLSFYRPKVKQDAIPHLLKNGTLRAMLYYLDNDAIGDGYLLRGSRKGGRLDQPGMAEQNLNALVAKLGKTIGLENLSPHDCRHYCASKLARQGKSVRELMDFFGWTSASTAMRYVDSSKWVEAD